MTLNEPPRLDTTSLSDLRPPPLTRTRNVLRGLLALAVLLPCAFVVWYAWSSYDAQHRLMVKNIGGMADVAEEHALKVLEINEQINARVLELLRSKSNDDIRNNPDFYYQLLNGISETMPQVQSINVFDEDGTRIVSSLYFRKPQPNVKDREDFRHHLLNPSGDTYVSPLYEGRASKALVFNLSVARRNGEKFIGVVNTSLRPTYFSEYYKQVIASTEGAAISLIHARGSLLARYPAVDKLLVFPSDDPLVLRFSAGDRSGTHQMTSAVDGQTRYFAYRRVGSYPLYIAASFPVAVWEKSWRRQVAKVAALTLLPSFALWILLLLTLRQIKREERVWEQWRAEVTQRESIELAFKQARRLEALGQLTGGVAHDFNNLLMVIATSTMVLRRRMQDQPDSEQALGALERTIEAGKRLTRQLLAFSRKQSLHPKVMDVGSHIRDFIELVRASLGGRIQLELDIAEGLKPIYADEVEFELALLHLALLARDAMPEGGRLKISVHAIPANAEVEEQIAIAFEDTGPGIETQNLDRSLDPVFAAKTPGQGVGLAQVTSFCEEAGGSLLINSVPGVGTTATMLLPVTVRPV